MKAAAANCKFASPVRRDRRRDGLLDRTLRDHVPNGSTVGNEFLIILRGRLPGPAARRGPVDFDRRCR